MPVAIPKQFAACLPKDWGVPGAELEALIDCWFKSQLSVFVCRRDSFPDACWMSRALGLLVTHGCHCGKKHCQ